jgi:hypothetical protein
MNTNDELDEMRRILINIFQQETIVEKTNIGRVMVANRFNSQMKDLHKADTDNQVSEAYKKGYIQRGIDEVKI